MVDIQGSDYIYTDPQLHSVDKSYGRADRGEVGIEKFFATHKCNDVCRHLGLKESYRRPVAERLEPERVNRMVEKSRKRRLEAESKPKKKKPKKGSPEYIESKIEHLIERVRQWSKEDEGAINRAREAAQQTDWCNWSFKCPVRGCKTKLPSQEILDLHVRGVQNKKHRRHF